MWSITLQELFTSAPGLNEIWRLWVGLFPHWPIWDPYLALFCLVFVGMFVTYYIVRLAAGS